MLGKANWWLCWGRRGDERSGVGVLTVASTIVQGVCPTFCFRACVRPSLLTEECAVLAVNSEQILKNLKKGFQKTFCHDERFPENLFFKFFQDFKIVCSDVHSRGEVFASGKTFCN